MDEADGDCLGVEPACPSHSVLVGSFITGEVEVNDAVDALDVDAPPKEIGGDEDSSAFPFEAVVYSDSVLLGHL